MERLFDFQGVDRCSAPYCNNDDASINDDSDSETSLMGARLLANAGQLQRKSSFDTHSLLYSEDESIIPQDDDWVHQQSAAKAQNAGAEPAVLDSSIDTEDGEVYLFCPKSLYSCFYNRYHHNSDDDYCSDDDLSQEEKEESLIQLDCNRHNIGASDTEQQTEGSPIMACTELAESLIDDIVRVLHPRAKVRSSKAIRKDYANPTRTTQFGASHRIEKRVMGVLDLKTSMTSTEKRGITSVESNNLSTSAITPEPPFVGKCLHIIPTVPNDSPCALSTVHALRPPRQGHSSLKKFIRPASRKLNIENVLRRATNLVDTSALEYRATRHELIKTLNLDDELVATVLKKLKMAVSDVGRLGGGPDSTIPLIPLSNDVYVPHYEAYVANTVYAFSRELLPSAHVRDMWSRSMN